MFPFSNCDLVHLFVCDCQQQTDRAAFLVRQFVKDSLYDRISTRPFLNTIEKKWIAFQLLCAVNQCHKLNVCYLLVIFECLLAANPWNTSKSANAWFSCWCISFLADDCFFSCALLIMQLIDRKNINPRCQRPLHYKNYRGFQKCLSR